MRACFVLSSADIGGFRTFTLNLGRQSLEDGDEAVVLLVARGSGEVGDIDSIQREIPVVICYQQRVWSRSRFIRRIVSTIEQIRPDVLVISHNAWVQAALPYLPEGILRYLIIHNVTNEELSIPAGNANWWDAVVGVSPAVEELLLARWPRERVRMIPVGVPCPSTAAQANPRDPTLRLCYVGRLEQNQKNVLCIPMIAAGLSARGISFHWTVVGDGPSRCALELELDSRGLSRQFTFVGNQQREGVEQQLSRNHVLVLPSFFESIGHVLQEAQMQGVVPIATRLAGATEFVITDGWDGLLCDTPTAEPFVSAISLLHVDRDRLIRLSSQAMQSVRKRFAISTIANMYRQMIDEDKPRATRRPRRRNVRRGFVFVPSALMPSRLKTATDLMRRRWRGSTDGR